MSEVLLSHLLGLKVHDVEGRPLGHLEELRAEMEVGEEGAEYVVVEFQVGAYGALQALAGSHFARHVLRLLGGVIRYRRYRVPWGLMDLSDPVRPVVRCAARELE